MKTQPLPAMGQDPSVIEGQQIRNAFDAQCRDVRMNVGRSDLEVARDIKSLWDTTNGRLAELYADLQKRRRARLAELDVIVPLGPSVPANASPADVAVIQQAFRAALAQAREAITSDSQTFSDPGSTITPIGGQRVGIAKMLADAEEFDDDTLRRAVLTAAMESGRMDLVRSWTDLSGITSLLDEHHELSVAIAGGGIAGQWNYTVFSRLPEPAEVTALPDLERLAAVAATARVQNTLRTQRQF